MVERNVARKLKALARRHPVVTVTGPRQSGKTTLCRMTFPAKRYVTLEPLDQRQFAQSDPRGFLAELPEGAILDEIQRVPDLLSYLQEAVDEQPTPGRFILTGSQNFGLLQSVSQSLAGRTATLHLLPLSLDELRRFPRAPTDLWTAIWMGGYPAIQQRAIPADEWLEGYVATYVERDVRQLLNVGDLLSFQTFMRLCAGRSAQLLNLSSLGADAGVSHNTAKAWIAVLETSFILFRLPPFQRNLTSRLVKMPKLAFHDTGLLCHLLGIRTPAQLESHPLRGAIFETWVATEIGKARMHQGVRADLSHYRDRKGHEVDLIIDTGDGLVAVESKSGRTFASDFLTDLHVFADRLGATKDAPPLRTLVVYGGDVHMRREHATLLPWSEIDKGPWGA